MGAFQIGQIVISAACIGAGPGVRIHHTPARCVPGLPIRDYQHRAFSRSVSSLSATSIPLVPGDLPGLATTASVGEAPFALKVPGTILAPNGMVSMERASVAYPPVQGKLFQFLQPSVLAIDHCTVSKMGATLDSDGRWFVSLRADQNFGASLDATLVGTAVPDQIRTSVRQTGHILRDLFFVRVRFYASRPTGASVSPIGAGDPVVWSVDLPPFWVQRGQSRSMQWSDVLPPDLARRAFDRVERVEIEYHYQLQEGLTADLP
ncbi:hypothetical protein EP7_005303 [Isosphaeraceae bacterium EP7]